MRKNKALPFRLSEQDRLAIEALAQAHGKTMGAIVRDVLTRDKEVVEMRNRVTKEILNSLNFVGDQSKAAAKQGVVGNMRDYADSLPCSRNGKYFPGGLAQYNAQERARKELRTKGMSDELITKQMDMGMPDFVPGGVTSWQALDEWRTAAHVASQMQESADAMNAMMSNVINDPALEGKGKLLTDLADGFAMRVASLPKTKERSKDQTTLAHVRKLAELYSGIDAIKAILGE